VGKISTDADVGISVKAGDFAVVGSFAMP